MPGKNKYDDKDDLLILITQDGRVLEDPDMYLDIGAGLIRSERYHMTMQATEPIALLEFMQVNKPPVQVGTCYAYDDDPPHVSNDSYIMNNLLGEVEQQSRTGRWKETSFIARAASTARYWICGITIVLCVAALLLQPYCQPPDTRLTEQVGADGEVRTIQIVDVPSLNR